MKSKLRFSLLVLVLLSLGSEAQGQVKPFWTTLSAKGFTQRQGLTASLFNGKIYTIGGVLYPWFKENLVEVYNPTTDLWSTPKTIGRCPPHYAHTANVVGSKIYIIGGVQGLSIYDDTVWVFNPIDNSWSLDTIMDEGNAPHPGLINSTSCVIGDSIYVFGGVDLGGSFSSTVQIYDTKRHRWSFMPQTADSMRTVTTPKSFLVGDKMYVVGLPGIANGQPEDTACHCTVQVYDPVTNRWRWPSTDTMRFPRFAFVGESYTTPKHQTQIRLIGGISYNGGNDPPKTDTYDTLFRKWGQELPDGEFTVRIGAASCLIGDKIYVIGGVFGRGATDTSLNQVLTIPQLQSVENGFDKIFYYSRIYPNPATTTLNIVSVEVGTPFKILDILGREAMIGKTLDNATLTVDISNLSTGFYYVLVERADMKGQYSIAGKLAVIGK
ncbi:MAG: T9SS type A sorting domain-containing protein [bacterium]